MAVSRSEIRSNPSMRYMEEVLLATWARCEDGVETSHN